MEVSKDFRIGNLIADYEIEVGYFAIEEIKKNEQGNLAVYYRNGSCISVDPEPIPLSEDILLKCGFEQIISSKEMNVFEIKNKENIFEIWLNDFGFIYNDTALDLDIKYLHQLQNLYFSLTNTELTLNL